jgi:hypothetical protein
MLGFGIAALFSFLSAPAMVASSTRQRFYVLDLPRQHDG